MPHTQTNTFQWECGSARFNWREREQDRDREINLKALSEVISIKCTFPVCIGCCCYCYCSDAAVEIDCKQKQAYTHMYRPIEMFL